MTMNILMLDKSFITDRRIVLEAEALIAQGHHVILCSGRENLEQESLGIDNQLKIYRIFTNPLLEYCLKNTNIEEVRNLSKCLGHYKNHESSRLKAYFKFAIKYPKWAIIQLNRINAPLPEKVHKMIEFILSILSRNINILRQSFKSPFQYWINAIENSVFSHFKPDVIHCHDFSSLETGVALAQKYQIPLIYDAHELYSYQPGIPSWISKNIFAKEKRLIHFAHTCITVNKQQADIMAKDFNYHQFLPISNATAEPKDFNPNHNYNLIRQATKIPQNEYIMLFQGGINRLRKIDLLMHGLAMVNQKIHLVFLTFESEINEFKALAQNLNISDRVHFLPVVPWDDMVYWAASADVGILPYQADDMNTRISSPNKMYEFICAATPMIASTELINVHQILTEENFGVSYRLKEPKDYARAIEIMFDENLGGPKRFKADLIEKRHKYLWSHEANKLINFYSRLSEQHNIPLPNKEELIEA
jgi:glycosyltransferase involved in cell wall biosynthesis